MLPARPLTFSEYSTWMMRHWRMEGPTGGIFSARPCHTSRFPAAMASPTMLVTTDFFCFLAPRAMKLWVWMMAALGTTARLVQLSISAKIGMTSPTKTDPRVGDGAWSCLREFQHRITKGWSRYPAAQARGAGPAEVAHSRSTR